MRSTLFGFGGLFAAALAALIVWSTSPADAGTASFIATTNCLEHQAFVDGDAAAVAAHLPKRYTPVRDTATGRPLLFVRGERCDGVTLDGRTAPVTMASFGVVVNTPDGRGCASGAPALGSVKGDVPPLCNWYTLFWLANDRRIVDWLRSGTPGFPAFYVPGLRLSLGAVDPAIGGAPFHFVAPAPSPSPFTIDAVARERPGQLSVRGGYWVDTPNGTVKLAFSSDDLTSGDESGTVHAAHGSEMAALFGADERSYSPDNSFVSAERWAHGSYRKQVLPPGPRSDSFSGSCSVQGTVHFTPPATNTLTPLVYSYDARGTCSGALDGRSISGAPVAIHQSGPADGSCPRATTTSPGSGAITFADGTTIRYTLDFSSVATEVNYEFYGERSGTASGQGNFLTQRTPPDLALRCANGVSDAPLDMTLTTGSPLVSDRDSTAGRTPPGASAQRIGLAVHPRRVQLGRRTIFVFKVTAAGSALRGVEIDFAGQRVRTDRHGRATIRATLRRRGRWIARATKPGFGATRIAIWAAKVKRRG